MPNQSTTTTHPTVLIIHGAWHNPAHFAPLISQLHSAGYPSLCPAQPTINAPPGTGLQNDADCISSSLRQLVETEGKDVIVLMHSYGGVIGTQAVHASFGRDARKAKGLTGGVVGLLYMCAFILPLGVSLAGAFGGELPPFIRQNDDGTCVMLDPAHHFYHDLPGAEQQEWIRELAPHPTVSQKTPISYTAYAHHPVWYLYCEADRALPLSVQEGMVEGMRKGGVNVETRSCGASHSPFLSCPGAVADLVREVERGGWELTAWW